jgi:hypothetical protein
MDENQSTLINADYYIQHHAYFNKIDIALMAEQRTYFI